MGYKSLKRHVFVWKCDAIVDVAWCNLRKSLPVVWSDGVTVEVRSITEETCSLDYVLRYHTQTVQNVAQLAEIKTKMRQAAQGVNTIFHSAAEFVIFV